MDYMIEEAIAGLLSILVSVMDIVSSECVSIFNLDVGTFYATMPVFKTLIGGFTLVGAGLAIVLFLLRLLRNIVAVTTGEEIEPTGQLIARFIIALLLIVNSSTIISLEFEFARVPYQVVTQALEEDTKNAELNLIDNGVETVKDTTWNDLASAIEDEMSLKQYAEVVPTSVVFTVVSFLLVCVIFFNELKLILEGAERYVVISISYLFFPLVAALFTSKETSKPVIAYLKVVGNQLMLMAFNVMFVVGSMNAINRFVLQTTKRTLMSEASETVGHAVAGSVLQQGATIVGLPIIGGALNYIANLDMGGVSVFVFCLLILAILIVGQKMDQFMRSIGLDVVQTGSALDEVRSAGASVRGALMSGYSLLNNGASKVKGVTKSAGIGAGAGAIAGAVANGGFRTADASMKHAMKSGTAQAAGSALARGLTNPENNMLTSVINRALGDKNAKALNLDNTGSFATKRNGIYGITGKNGAKGELAFGDAAKNLKASDGWKTITTSSGLNAKIRSTGAMPLGINTPELGKQVPIGQYCSSMTPSALENKIPKEKLSEFKNGYSLEARGTTNANVSDLYAKGTDASGNIIEKKVGQLVTSPTGMNMRGVTPIENEVGGTFGYMDNVSKNDIEFGMKGMTNGADGYINGFNGDACVCVPSSDAMKQIGSTIQVSDNLGDISKLQAVDMYADADGIHASFLREDGILEKTVECGALNHMPDNCYNTASSDVVVSLGENDYIEASSLCDLTSKYNNGADIGDITHISKTEDGFMLENTSGEIFNVSEDYIQEHGKGSIDNSLEYYSLADVIDVNSFIENTGCESITGVRYENGEFHVGAYCNGGILEEFILSQADAKDFDNPRKMFASSDMFDTTFEIKKYKDKH